MHRRSRSSYETIRRLIVYIVMAILLIGLGIIHEINKSFGFTFTQFERPLVFKKS